MKVSDFKGDISWKRVCKVALDRHYGEYEWYYTDINRDLMFSEHRSWVYAITVYGRIVKIGETGNPLGVIASRSYYDDFSEVQPKPGSQSRLGRYRRGDDTDRRIRESLISEARNNAVEIYAYQCPEIEVPLRLGGEIVIVKSQIHKQLEKIILDKIIEKDGEYPELNLGRA